MPSIFITLQKPCGLEGEKKKKQLCSLECSDLCLQTLNEVSSKQQEENAAGTGKCIQAVQQHSPKNASKSQHRLSFRGSQAGR